MLLKRRPTRSRITRAFLPSTPDGRLEARLESRYCPEPLFFRTGAWLLSETATATGQPDSTDTESIEAFATNTASDTNQMGGIMGIPVTSKTYTIEGDVTGLVSDSPTGGAPGIEVSEVHNFAPVVSGDNIILGPNNAIAVITGQTNALTWSLVDSASPPTSPVHAYGIFTAALSRGVDSLPPNMTLTVNLTVASNELNVAIDTGNASGIVATDPATGNIIYQDAGFGTGTDLTVSISSPLLPITPVTGVELAQFVTSVSAVTTTFTGGDVALGDYGGSFSWTYRVAVTT